MEEGWLAIEIKILKGGSDYLPPARRIVQFISALK